MSQQKDKRLLRKSGLFLYYRRPFRSENPTETFIDEYFMIRTAQMPPQAIAMKAQPR